jgi:hypothetical protein
MKKQKAIRILKEQSEKLKPLEILNTHNWTVETQTYLSEFFGKQSYQSEHFKIISFLNDCSNIISNKGLYKSPTENWFSKLPDWIINLGLPALCFISFGTGILFTNNNNLELRNENKKLKEQLLLISSDSITNQQEKMSNKPK